MGLFKGASRVEREPRLQRQWGSGRSVSGRKLTSEDVGHFEAQEVQLRLSDALRELGKCGPVLQNVGQQVSALVQNPELAEAREVLPARPSFDFSRKVSVEFRRISSEVPPGL